MESHIKYLTVEELAGKLVVNQSWVYARTRRKGKERIPHLKVGRYCRFRLPEVLAWLEEQQKENVSI